MKGNESLRKIRFLLDSEDWHGRNSETVWGELLAGNRYRIRNSPFLAKGVSFQDIVEVTETAEGLQYKSTSIGSGHSTYRISLHNNHDPKSFNKFWKPLQELGCTYESALPAIPIYAVDVPSEVDLDEVYRLLEVGEREGVWGFEEGHVAKTREVKGREDLPNSDA